MDENALAELIRQTVDATSTTNEPNYTVLASIILLMVVTFLVVTKYMGTQIIKQHDKSATKQENLLRTIGDNVGQHGIDLGKHEVRISANEKDIANHRDSVIKLFETKADKA